MAHKKPKFTNFSTLLQYFISMYYVQRERDLLLTTNLKKHITVSDKIERDYHKHLSLKYPQWDNEENRIQYRNQVDYLTGIYTRQKAEDEKKEKLQAFKNKLKR